MALENKMTARFEQQDAKLEMLRRDMVIKLGSMIFIGVGLIIAAMRLMGHG